ncbi:MAG: hypothetical protein U0Q19_10115 [Kineosporiaceae bacterium]
MTSHTHQASTEAAPDLLLRAVEALTDAARDGGTDGTPTDPAALMTRVVAAVAANLGSLDRLLAGRPGSWEADLIRQIVTAELGDDPVTWRAHRTAPVLVRVCVAQVADQVGLNLDDALDLVDAEHLEADRQDDRSDAAWLAARDRVIAGYHVAFSHWANAFRDGVATLAATWPELVVPVVVEVDTDPYAPWWATAYQRWLTAADDAHAATLTAAGRRHAGDPSIPAPLTPTASIPARDVEDPR